MRQRLILCGVVLLSTWMFAGCGSSGSIQEGMPEDAKNLPAPDVDMGQPANPVTTGGAPQV